MEDVARMLFFRNYMNVHPELHAEYCRVKEKAVRERKFRNKEYNLEKAPFIAEIMAKRKR